MGFLFSGSLVSRQDAQDASLYEISDRFFSIVALGSLLLGFPLQNEVPF